MNNKYGKLVRNHIPDIIKNNGEIPITKILNDQEYYGELQLKLLEEAKETISAKNDQELLEELADIIEVIIALGKTKNITLQEILKEADIKREKRGSFSDKIYLENVEQTLKR
ncbi:MAG: nucleoside triphosphate pyrophosphohydrolase [Bacilli bacterium]|nr:nucleoside triphosphate pyrophosphohydrolase [Bacilli bacterium]